MNVKKFSDAMSELDSKYIDEALNYKKKAKRSSRFRWGAIAACLCLIICIITIPRLVSEQTHGDYPAAIMVKGTIYLLSEEPVLEEIDDDDIIGYTTSYTDGFPQKNGETNFSRELNLPYAKVENGIAVFYENEWHLFTPK